MALNKESQQSIEVVQETIANFSGKPSSWSPKLGSLESILENSYAFLYQDTGAKSLTVFYMVEDAVGTALYSQSFKSNGSAGSRSKLISNIYFNDESDAKVKAFYDLEQKLGLDLDGDGWLGSGLVVVQSGAKVLAASDLMAGENNDFISLGLGANGRAGSKLTIDMSAGFEGKQIVIGANSVDPLSTESAYVDGILSSHQVAFPGIGAGVGPSKQGTVDIKSADLHVTGGLISTYIAQAFDIKNADNMVLGGVGVGIGARSKGTLAITDSSLHFYRGTDPADLLGSDSDVLNAMLGVGEIGGTGSATITNSLLEYKGTQNNISVGNEGGGKGDLMVIGSNLLLDGQYSINEVPNSDNDLASSRMNVGYGKNSKGTASFDHSQLLVDGLNSSISVGIDGANGSLVIKSSEVQQIAKRTLDPLTRDMFALSVEDYANSWSASYLQIGVDDSDGSARSNLTTVGSMSLTDSTHLIRGPHAGIEVGGGGTKSTGTLTISHSTVEVVGSGAIQTPDTATSYDAEYLAAGINSSGSLDSWYFTYMNIGGSSWQDFGGVGTVNLLNGSKLKLFSMDINSNDSAVAYSNAGLAVGGWGTKASLNIDGGSALSVGGRTMLGISQDMSDTNFNKSDGLYNIKNYSLVNVKNGSLETFSYESRAADQTLTGTDGSPVSTIQMYTTLGKTGILTANHFTFQKNSQILGEGTLNVQDPFLNQSILLNDDLSRSTEYAFTGSAADGTLDIDQSQIFVGDTLNFTNLAKTSAFGTLNLQSRVGESQNASISINNSSIFFDLGKTQSDQLVIDGFDNYTFNNNTFVINNKGAIRGSKHILIDFKFNTESPIPDITSFPEPTIKLVGNTRGEIFYDDINHDLIFSVA